jgi:hypothetical protein
MSESTPTLDGLWQISGLPQGDMVAIFTMTQVDNYVTGTLDIAGSSTQSYSVEGNNNFPNVALGFKLGRQQVFTFKGSFTDGNNVVGSLSGQYTGAATLSRADG